MMDQLMLGDDEIFTWIKKSKTIESMIRLPGDASTRKYYRIVAEGRTYIVMRMESFLGQQHSLPFLVVQKHLREAAVNVPEVLDVDAERGFILLEDLGDVTLLRRLQDVNHANTERHLYERVIDALVQLQVHASPKVQETKNLEAFKLRFDHEKLMWEVRFTLENFYQIHLKRTLTEKDYEIISKSFGEICTFLANQPTVLAHRDFHSRNIMIAPSPSLNDRMVMIDFQDARMGPPQYDLASLLKDSYYQLEDSQVEALLSYYIRKYESVAQRSIDSIQFRRIFDFMSIQRNFKAIGSFASFMNRRGDPSYLKYIGNTFENIRRTLLKYKEYSELRELLFHYYYF